MSSNFSRLRASFRDKAPKVAPSPTTPVATSDYWSSAKSELAPMLLRPQQQQQQQQQQLKLEEESPTSTMMMMSGDRDYYLDVAAASFQQQLHLAPLDMHLKQAHQQQQQQFASVHPHLNQDQLAFAADLDDYDDYAVPSDESCCRLDRSQVELVQLIGEGQKGYVFLGKLQSKDGQSIIDVAIKTLKFETEQLIERLMNEAAMMKQLEHPHIIKFIGMCPETPALIAMELAQFGEIKLYLRLNQRFIKCSQLVLFAFQISTALSYLESKNYVHRDVAARNVLVCSHSCVKLADFGLSRNLQPNFLFANTTGNLDQRPLAAELLDGGFNQQQQQQQNLYVAAPRVKLPVRWLAPESLVFRRFTSASDVWMFAVCVWEFLQFGQVRPWAHLRNNQVLAAIELGQRLTRPEACPERLYQLMLRSWSYAPVQRPKFREIKQCIWSIYLSERTREQLELERLERLEREQRQQRFMMMHQQQHQPVGQHHQLQVPLLATSNHDHLHHDDCDQTRTVASQARPGSSGSSPNMMLPNTTNRQMVQNHTPSSNYSSTMTTNTTNDNEQSISPCSSAFNSMGRAAAAAAASREPSQQQQAKVSTRNTALRNQISRFEQRQAHSPIGNNTRPHVLQKQRSQGAIGMTTTSGFEGYDERPVASRRGQANDARGLGRLNSKAAAGRRSNQMQPLDDEALEYVKRGLRRSQTNERQSVVIVNKLGGDTCLNDEQSGSEVEEDDDDDRGDEDEDQLWIPSQRFISASPALTADVGSQSRMVSIEPAYEGVFVANKKQESSGGFSRPNDQIAMLKANLDPSDGSRMSPNSGLLLASSPALTSSNSPTRPASWRSTPAPIDKNNNNNNSFSHRANTPQRPASRISAGKKPQLAPSSRQSSTKGQPVQQQQPDQLGVLLQALRITPMKAKLRSSPEQNVRVLKREERRPMVSKESSQMIDERGSPLEPQRGPTSRDQLAKLQREQQQQQQHEEREGHLRQMMLHQRLLGRIRPSSSSPSPSLGGDLLQQQKNRDGVPAVAKSKRPKSQVVIEENEEHQLMVGHDGGNKASGINRRLPHQNRSVEAVDHSLQILESLMSSGEPSEQKPRSREGGVAPATTASLPRRSHR